MRIEKNLNDLTERYESDDDDESDKHLEARDRRYSCLMSSESRCVFFQLPQSLKFIGSVDLHSLSLE